jgi:cytidine deaminase
VAAKRERSKASVDRLVAAAIDARERAYAPYSEFQVGAAIEAASGKIYSGCNVENIAYGSTICAERVAATRAVADGEREFLAVAVATEGGHSPCGACRQVLAEFGPHAEVYIVDASSGKLVGQKNLAKLLPEQFEFEPPKGTAKSQGDRAGRKKKPRR